MNKQEIFLRKQDAIITKWVSKILREQQEWLVAILTREIKSYEKKSMEDYVREYIEKIKIQIPDYLFISLQSVMQKAYKLAFKPYASYLKDYQSWLVFNVDSSSAVRYLRNMQNLHLSQRDGSIAKTTEKEILTILADWVKSGKSYTQIWKEIQATDPFVFSRERAKLIAIQETGQAYGWSSFEPAKEMQRQGYVMEKIWATSKDWRVRETHRENEAQGYIPLENIWQATGDMYAPSKDFRCRCTSTTRIVWIK